MNYRRSFQSYKQNRHFLGKIRNNTPEQKSQSKMGNNAKKSHRGRHQNQGPSRHTGRSQDHNSTETDNTGQTTMD